MSRRHSYIRSQVRKYPYPAKVAEALGVHTATVYRACDGMDIALIREAHESGISLHNIIVRLKDLPYSTIAEKFGVSVQYVHKVMREHKKEEHAYA